MTAKKKARCDKCSKEVLQEELEWKIDTRVCKKCREKERIELLRLSREGEKLIPEITKTEEEK